MTDVERITDQTITRNSIQFGRSSSTSTDKSEISDAAIVIGYGVDTDLRLEASIGKTKFKDEQGGEMDGDRFGGVVRLNGLIGAFHYGNLENDDLAGKLTQLDVGYGFSTSVAESGNIYGVMMFSKFSAEFEATTQFINELSESATSYNGQTVTITSWANDYEEDQVMLLVFGVEFNPRPNVSAAIELHAVAETGISFMVRVSL